MNKTTLLLPGSQKEWGSYISKYQPDSQQVLDNMFTVDSKNFVTDQTGMIDKRQGGTPWNRTSFGNVARDSYEAVFESGARHFLRVGGGVLSASTGTGLFDTITSGYSTLGYFEWATYQDRVYGCNGVNPPQVYDTVTSYGGVTYVFTTGKTKLMGAQAPVSAPTAGTPTSGGNVPNGAHTYKVTFMYYGSEESNGSPASAAQTSSGSNHTIPLSNIPIGGYGVTARNIYRDNNDGVWLLLDTINDNTTTTYSDVLAQGATPTPIPTFNNTPPTFGKIALWLDALWIAPTGETNLLRYSNAGSPDIFDPDNFVRCQSDDVITAITVYNGKLFVHGLHSFGSIEGTTPDTFFYHNISNNIGCTDNRSIQIRSIVSVPTLWWLSDKGLYYSNGYTVEYGSDLIQDLVNLNLAQVNYSTNKNTQTSFADFSSDTYSPGIDINSNPGAVTTINPEKVYSQQSDWEGGSVTTNLRTKDGNLLEVPTQFAPTLPSGTLSGAIAVSGSNLVLNTQADFTGVDHTSDANQVLEVGTGSAQQTFMQSFTAPRAGTVTSALVEMPGGAGGAFWSWRIRVMSDSLGLPSSTLFLGPTHSSVPTDGVYSLPISYAVSANQRFWVGVDLFGGNYNGSNAGSNTNLQPGESAVKSFNLTSWTSLATIKTLADGYTFSQTPIPSTGTWTSAVFDSMSIAPIPSFLIESGSYPASTSATTTISTSATPDMATPNTQSVSSPNGSNSLSLTGLRYYQITVQLNSTDNRVTPTVGSPVLDFSITSIWVSQPINATTDNTGWGTLTYTGNAPAGTSILLEIATSANNITYSSFGPISGAVTQPWAKIRLTLTATSDDVTSPSVTSTTLTWMLSSNIQSTPIDTGTVPAGFSTVQWGETNFSAGTVTMYVRTASTALLLASATYVQVNNGDFPNLTPQEFVQWKLVLTSSADDLPVVTDVTINWFVGTSTSGVRCASLFYNKTYYLSVATIGSTFNNTIIQLDQFGKWRIQKDNSVGTLLLYFNKLYFTDGQNDNIYNGFIANTDNGTAIVMDVRTKAWNDSRDLFLKIPRGLKITGLHTGTVIHAYYSPDRGSTWYEMLNENGVTGYQTNTSGTEFVVLFVPDATTLNSGRTLIYRIVSSDTFPCSIINFEPSMYTRRARYLNNG